MKNTYKLGLVLTLGIGLLIILLMTAKGCQFKAMGEASKAGGYPPTSVSTFTAETQNWEQTLYAVGSIQPVLGVELVAEVAGLVTAIHFENGQSVQKDDLLLELDVRVEQAQLRSAQANANLAQLELNRSQILRESGSVTQSQLDRAVADLEKALAEVENLKALIDRKRIHAPFDGELGIRHINIGEYIQSGAAIVNLQSQAQVFVNFTLPQQALAQLQLGLPIRLSTKVYPDQVFEGSLTALSPQVDPITRTVEVQGTFENPDALLRTGLFVKATVVLPDQQTVTVVPATSIIYSAYGNSIFKVEPQLDESGQQQGLIAVQELIRIGERRGDFVSIPAGVTAGDTVVSAGGFKLRNNSPIIINNELAPKPKLDPTPDNS